MEIAKKDGAVEKAIAIATEMKKEGLSVSQITRITGLSQEQVEKL